MRRLELHVERVVLDGVPPMSHEALATAIGDALRHALGPQKSFEDSASLEETTTPARRPNGAADFGGRIGRVVAPAVLAAVGPIGDQGRR